MFAGTTPPHPCLHQQWYDRATLPASYEPLCDIVLLYFVLICEKVVDGTVGLGLDCPDRWTTAEFSTSVSDQHERNIRFGWMNYIPRFFSTDGSPLIVKYVEWAVRIIIADEQAAVVGRGVQTLEREND